MEKPSLVQIDNFQGLAGNVHPARMAPSRFQTDLNGDLFREGSWRVRRGAIRIPIDPMANSVSAVFSFETRAGDLAFLVIDQSGNFAGYNSLSSSGVPTAESDLEGFGVEGFGTGEFGA